MQSQKVEGVRVLATSHEALDPATPEAIGQAQAVSANIFYTEVG